MILEPEIESPITIGGAPAHAPRPEPSSVAGTNQHSPGGQRADASAHYSQLDALRSVAVGLVIWQHAGIGPLLSFGQHGIGVYGVWLFFVLSGFLITGILLREKAALLAGTPCSQIVHAFYARRFLRIFPLFYLVLGIEYVLGAQSIRADLGWHLLYLSNWHFFLNGSWPGSGGPLWSLAVEEQFYLVWPFLILLTPARRVLLVLALAAMVGPLSRIGLALGGATSVQVLVPTFSNFDCLALGGILAWLHHGGVPARLHVAEKFAEFAMLGGAALMLIAVAIQLLETGWRLLALTECLSAALVSVFLVHRCATGLGGRIGQLMQLRSLVYIGTISYGVYLYHSVVIWLLRDQGLPERLREALGSLAGPLAYFALVCGCTIAIAALSWRVFERPINDRKKYFPYAQVSAARSAG